MSLRDRLEAGLQLSDNGCLEWQKCKHKTGGYGKINPGTESKKDRTHCVAYEIYFGQIPTDKEVMHTCDNRICCRPSHLKLGTHSENMRDMLLKSRQAFGERNGNAKLSEAIVTEIQTLLKIGVRNCIVARRFNISQSMIGFIKRGKNWNRLQAKELK